MQEGRRKHINSDEDALFREAVKGTRPLEHRPKHSDRPKPAPRARFTREADEAVLEESLRGLPDASDFETGESLQFRRPHVSERTLRRLRRGRYSVQVSIDLHGLTAEQAVNELKQALTESIQAGHSCVRVVHGKGLRSGPRGPVLKARVASILRRHRAVLAFCSAPERDGGTGAAYVLLRVDR